MLVLVLLLMHLKLLHIVVYNYRTQLNGNDIYFRACSHISEYLYLYAHLHANIYPTIYFNCNFYLRMKTVHFGSEKIFL